MKETRNFDSSKENKDSTRSTDASEDNTESIEAEEIEKAAKSDKKSLLEGVPVSDEEVIKPVERRPASEAIENYFETAAKSKVQKPVIEKVVRQKEVEHSLEIKDEGMIYETEKTEKGAFEIGFGEEKKKLKVQFDEELTEHFAALKSASSNVEEREEVDTEADGVEFENPLEYEENKTKNPSGIEEPVSEEILDEAEISPETGSIVREEPEEEQIKTDQQEEEIEEARMAGEDAAETDASEERVNYEDVSETEEEKTPEEDVEETEERIQPVSFFEEFPPVFKGVGNIVSAGVGGAYHAGLLSGKGILALVRVTGKTVGFTSKTASKLLDTTGKTVWEKKKIERRLKECKGVIADLHKQVGELYIRKNENGENVGTFEELLEHLDAENRIREKLIKELEER